MKTTNRSKEISRNEVTKIRLKPYYRAGKNWKGWSFKELVEGYEGHLARLIGLIPKTGRFVVSSNKSDLIARYEIHAPLKIANLKNYKIYAYLGLSNSQNFRSEFMVSIINQDPKIEPMNFELITNVFQNPNKNTKNAELHDWFFAVKDYYYSTIISRRKKIDLTLCDQNIEDFEVNHRGQKCMHDLESNLVRLANEGIIGWSRIKPIYKWMLKSANKDQMIPILTVYNKIAEQAAKGDLAKYHRNLPKILNMLTASKSSDPLQYGYPNEQYLNRFEPL